MQLTPSDPDIQTLVTRIRQGEIRLQPEFQRGEVWGQPKKRRLIDSILRNWHVPPIHIVVVKDNGEQEVLDGQQRLVSIRDFVDARLTVDGYTEPYDENIRRLHGLKYEELPLRQRRQFDNFTIRVFKLTDYAPGEPGELFFRLNQPTNLTAAEQRNAFFGPARMQVKQIVREFPHFGIDERLLGFSNSRMSYDDVVSRVCYAFHKGTLKERITTQSITAMFRSQEAYAREAVERVTETLDFFGSMRAQLDTSLKFNKATLFSWLCFLGAVNNKKSRLLTSSQAAAFVNAFELMRSIMKGKGASEDALFEGFAPSLSRESVGSLMLIYNDRASARVADVSSVLGRDAILWLLFVAMLAPLERVESISPSRAQALKCLARHFSEAVPAEEVEGILARVIEKYDWGAEL